MDQTSKFYIKLNYPLSGYGVPAILDWGVFKILFVENSGMAMGTKLNDFIPFITEKKAKLVLTLLRIIAIFGLGYWLWDSVRKRAHILLKLALALIFAGALGNIIDSVFYGLIFSDSHNNVASLLPEQGYAPLFYGRVVDMLQFPLVEWDWPDWMPWIGGQHFLAAPCGLMSFMLALNYKVQADVIAKAILISSVGSTVTISLAAGL